MGSDNQRCSKSNSNNQEAFRKNTDNNSNKNKSFNEEEFSIEDLDMKKKLGEGGFGTVYLCEYKKTKQLIAVKIFNIQGITNERKKMIEKESKLLSLITKISLNIIFIKLKITNFI
jgi:predicted Ser/Thr protein kinase